MSRRAIAVIGGSVAPPEVLAMAFEVGAEVARRGFHLVCGGRGGVMEAACRGAWSCAERDGAQVIGILPGAEAGEGNDYLDVVIPTGLGLARNVVVVLSGSAVIAIDGGAGTLSEIALAWQHGRPIIALAPSGGWAARLGGLSLDGSRDRPILVAQSPHEAVEMAIRAMGPP